MIHGDVFTIESVGDTIVVSPLLGVGAVAEERTGDEINSVLERLTTGDAKHVVVDFASIPYFGSTLLEALLKLWQRAQTRGGKMVVCNLSDVGREVLEVAKFDTLWPIFPSRVEALDAVEK